MSDDGEWEDEVEVEVVEIGVTDDGDLEDDDEIDEEGDELEVPVSEELETQLQGFVIIENWELAISRAETLDFLVDNLRELEDEDAVDEWVQQYGERDFHLSQERDGRLVITDVFPVSGALLGLIPKAVIAPLFAELTAQSDDDLEGWLESLSDLIGDWLLLLTDEEKMVGHLIRAHELPVGNTAEEQEVLVIRHAELHGKN
ncbi:MAG TPA: hypothetical protein VHA57_11205 [Actinomycetota bacterium]|nr:hypothetical protein [Actinomycetota bacterium]